jgi:hypothetical protein
MSDDAVSIGAAWLPQAIRQTGAQERAGILDDSHVSHDHDTNHRDVS